jgi:hypothetical protein
MFHPSLAGVREECIDLLKVDAAKFFSAAAEDGKR